MAVASSTRTCDVDDPWTIQLGSEETLFNNVFSASMSGSSGNNEYTIHVDSSRGNITQGTRTTTVIANRLNRQSSNLTIYSIIGADSSGALAGYAYCNSADVLTDLYLQSTSNSTGLIKTGITGTCSFSSPYQGQDEGGEDSYQAPSECLIIQPPASYPSVQGTDISLQMNQTGSVILPGNYTILPYNVIDCKNCSQTALGGWIEVHSIVNFNAPPNFCLGILYLYMESNAVSFPYFTCVGAQPNTLTFEATYDIGNITTNSTGSVTVVAADGTSGTFTTEGRTTTSSGGGLTTNAKIGIGVGIPLMVLLIFALIGFVAFRRKRTRQLNQQKELEYSNAFQTIAAASEEKEKHIYAEQH